MAESLTLMAETIKDTDLNHLVPLDLFDRGEIFTLNDQLPILLSEGALFRNKEIIAWCYVTHICFEGITLFCFPMILSKDANLI